MNPGDLLLVKDAQFFHGRTSFSDHLNAKDIFNYFVDHFNKIQI